MYTTLNGTMLYRLPRVVLTLALAAVLFGLAACDNVAVSPKSQASEELIFQDENAYPQYLGKLYAGLNVTGQVGPFGDVDVEVIADEGFSQYMRLYWQMQELPADGAVITYQDAGGAPQELNQSTWNPSNAFLAGMYSRIGFQVANANIFINQSQPDVLANREVSETLREEIPQFIAEARFLRGLSYYHALDLFGGVPIVTEDDAAGTAPPPYPGETKDEARRAVFDFVESEMLAITGEADTPEGQVLPDPSQQQYGRASKAAAYMVLANIYLNAEVYIGEARYSEAAEYAQKVIDFGYQLDDEYQHLFLADNHTADGIIFAIPNDGQRTQHFGGTQFLTHAAVINANMDPAAYGIDTGYDGLRTQPETVDLFETGDQRPVFDNTPGNQFFRSGQSLQVTDLLDPTAGYAVPKFQNKTSTGADGQNPTFPDTDYPLFRVAEAYLIYAEAVERDASAGDPSTALSYVNDVRERAGLTTDITSSELDLEFLLEERGREFFWEAKRRTDLVRFGRFTGSDYVWSWKGGAQNGTSIGACRSIYPLPAGELAANPNLPENETC
jgi:hypothetical protein